MTAPRFPLVYRVEAGVLAYNGATYFVEEYGAGCTSVEDGRARAAAWLTRRRPGLRDSGAFRVRVGRPCTVCAVSGVKPGCVRKRCEACGGRGTTPEGTFEVAAP